MIFFSFMASSLLLKSIWNCNIPIDLNNFQIDIVYFFSSLHFPSLLIFYRIMPRRLPDYQAQRLDWSTQDLTTVGFTLLCHLFFWDTDLGKLELFGYL